MAKQDLSAMTDKEFMQEWTSMGKEVEKGRERLKEFSKEAQKRDRLKQLNLEPGDLQLLQIGFAAGIESEEKVH